MYEEDPFNAECYRRIVNVKRPCTNPTEAYLLKRLAVVGSLPLVQLTQEERAMMQVLVARGVVVFEDGAYLQVVMG